MDYIQKDDHEANTRFIFEELAPDITAGGVIHLGAHLGEEIPIYQERGLGPLIMIEANPQIFAQLQARWGGTPGVHLFNYAIAETAGTLKLQLHTSRSGSVESASLLPMKRFSEIVPTLHTAGQVEVPALPLDDFMHRHGFAYTDFPHLVMDIQGGELKALQGARTVLQHIKFLVTEVALVELYEGAPMEAELLQYLQAYGLHKQHAIYHELYDANGTFPAWGECICRRTGA